MGNESRITTNVPLPAIATDLELAGREILIAFVDNSTRKGVYCSEDKHRIYLVTGKDVWFAFKGAIKYITAGKSGGGEAEVIAIVEQQREANAKIQIAINQVRMSNANNPTA